MMKIVDFDCFFRWGLEYADSILCIDVRTQPKKEYLRYDFKLHLMLSVETPLFPFTPIPNLTHCRSIC